MYNLFYSFHSCEIPWIFKNHLFYLFVSCGPSHRTNVISCLTVHDSDSSTASPLTPKPQNSHVGFQSSRLSKSMAVVAPSVKAQPVESSISAKIPLAVGKYHLFFFLFSVAWSTAIWCTFIKQILYFKLHWLFVLGLTQNYYMKPKRAAAATRQSSSSGERVPDPQQEPSRSQPLNLSQVTTSGNAASTVLKRCIFVLCICSITDF